MKTLFFNKSSFAHLLKMDDYITAVENVHSLHAQGKIIEPNLVHADAPNGEYHIKTGGVLGDKQYYGLKANGGFFNNSKNYSLPNILGIIYLSDATNAYPLAVFESSLISRMRTAAATAVAAKYLKPVQGAKLAIVGYGNQAEASIEALQCVTDIKTVKIAGRNMHKAENFAAEMNEKYTATVECCTVQEACETSNLIVTCTPSTEYFIRKEWVQEGTFIAAVGADSPGKNELDPEIFRTAKVVADIKKQIIKVGESQHAIKTGIISEEDIYCELGDLASGRVIGRKNDKEVIIYDSTGTAIQDIAVAAYIYEKLKDDKSIQGIDLFE